MKISDDYQAKVRLWAMRPTVMALPPGPVLPPFKCQRFANHAAMNRWKEGLLRELARNAARYG